MDLNKFTIDIDPDGDPLPASCAPAELLEIEKRCGAISGIACRFVDVNASYVECGHLLEILFKAGDPESYPSRNEIDRWMLSQGIGEVISKLNPFMTRVMLGASSDADD